LYPPIGYWLLYVFDIALSYVSGVIVGWCWVLLSRIRFVWWQYWCICNLTSLGLLLLVDRALDLQIFIREPPPLFYYGIFLIAGLGAYSSAMFAQWSTP
jgi:hypothetical protein